MLSSAMTNRHYSFRERLMMAFETVNSFLRLIRISFGHPFGYLHPSILFIDARLMGNLQVKLEGSLCSFRLRIYLDSHYAATADFAQNIAAFDDLLIRADCKAAAIVRRSSVARALLGEVRHPPSGYSG